MNKLVYSLLLFLVTPLIAPLAMADKYFERFSADQINDDVYVIHGPLEYPSVHNRGFMNNPAFIVTDKSVVVVDPGSTEETGEMLLKQIAKVTDKPVSHVFNTHVHGDHWLANDAIVQRFPEVKIIADPRMIKKAKAGEGELWLNRMISLTDGVAKGTEIAYPGNEAVDGQTLELAGRTFKIYSVGTAHSGTDIMIEYVEGETLFTGDNVVYQRIGGMDDASFRDTIKAVEKARSLNLKHYVPGHGSTGGVAIVDMQHEYLDTLYQQVSAHYDEGLQDFEMKPKVEQALVKFKDWSGFEDELGKHISLAILEVEKSMFE